MSKLEKLLSEQPLSKSGPDLDERMDTLFRSAVETDKRPALRIRPWQLAVAAMLCIAFGFGLSRILLPTPPDAAQVGTQSEVEAPYTTIYYIDASTFQTPPAKPVKDGLFWGKTVEPVITLSGPETEGEDPNIVVIVKSGDKGEIL